MNARFIIPPILSIFSIIHGQAQDSSSIVVHGQVADATTGQPLAYATIGLARTSIQTMSNESGAFQLKVPFRDRNDSIRITHIGYATMFLPVSQSGNRPRLIRLEEKAKALSEVVVKSINPLDLVRRAIAKIPENYPDRPYKLAGFYRLTGTRDRQIVDLSEAAFETYNPGLTKENRQFKLVKVRLDKDLTAFGGMDGINFGARPDAIMDDDVVANSTKSGLLSEEGLKQHDYFYRGVVDYNGRDAYRIEFDQKDGVRKSLEKGIFYIDCDNLAFLQITSWKSPKGLPYWDWGFKQKIMLKIVNVHMDLLQDSSYITYQRYGNKYYFSHLYGTGRWHIVGGRRHFELNPLRLKYDLLATAIDTTSIGPFPREEVLKGSRMLEDIAPDVNTDSTDAFWKDYNLIQADFNVDSAAKIIRANNATLHYKQILADKTGKLKKDKALRIDSILSFYFQKGQFNGMALIKSEGKVIFEKGYGVANKGTQMPNDSQTQFRIGSTSKQFTAMLIMQLENEHKLNLDDSAGKFLPGFSNGKVTIRQLLTHQSGIPDLFENHAYLSELMKTSYTVDELIGRYCSDSLQFEPGTRISYSNSGYIALAGIIEHVTGKKYKAVLKEKIFDPIGMSHSYFDLQDEDRSHLATGYVNEEPELIYPIANETGAGGITSTAEDLLLWNNALSTTVLLPKDKLDELFKPRVQWDDWGAYYGYGWMIDRLQFDVSRKHTVVYHPGTEAGFYDMLVRQPDKDIFIILLNNKGDFPRFDMTDLILNELN